VRYLDWTGRQRAARAPATGPPRLVEPERLVREYRTAAAYHREAALLAREGWRAEAVDDRLPRSVLAGALAWVGRILRVRPAPCLRVTYKRLR
jgi:hypothetical protein